MPTNNLSPKAKNKLGIASSIPPNMAERFGAAVSPYLQGAQALFPPTNPYGQVVSNFLLGQAPQAAQQMAAGYPNVLFNTSNPLGGNRIVNPVALDMALALPVATAVKGAGALAKSAPLVGGITAWHGSPHLFPPTPLNDLGEFNAAKIGSGEGAQAYGMGHYTAEARGTGEGYQNRLSQGRPPSHEFKEITGHSLGEAGVKDLLPVTDLAGANAARAKSQWLAQYTAQELLDFAPVARQVTTNPGAGHLYKVDIPDEQIARMLDWDKPLRQQPEEIRKILEKVAPSVKTVDTMSREELINTLQYIDRNGSYTDEMMINEFGRPATLDELRESAKMMDVDEYLAENMASDKHATGQSVYKQLVAKFGGGANQSTAAGQAKASELLQKAGIPGVRYLDAGSRGAGEGTSNFVVFPGNENMMTILERNGQARSVPTQANTLNSRQIRELIDKNSPNESLDFDALRSAIGGNSYELTNYDISKLHAGDLSVDASRAMPSKGAIVIGKDGEIIDGRHRAALAKSAGNTHIQAYTPVAASPESQAIARYREVKGPKSVVRMEAALRTAGVPLPKNEPVAYIQRLVDQAHRRN
jgi:hypothetical protein